MAHNKTDGLDEYRMSIADSIFLAHSACASHVSRYRSESHAHLPSQSFIAAHISSKAFRNPLLHQALPFWHEILPRRPEEVPTLLESIPDEALYREEP
jgi:hypothetical protein